MLREQFAATPLLPGDSSVSVKVGQVVTGAPGGSEVAWTLALRGGAAPELLVGSVEEADVTLVETFDAARALVSGDRTAAQLLEAGGIKIRGDARRLVSESALVEAAASASPGLREQTSLE